MRHALDETMADLVVLNGRITTLDQENPSATALSVRNGVFGHVGGDREIQAMIGPATRVIDAGGRRIIPGLNDSHTHLIRGGLNYDLELRWENIESVHDALALLKTQAAITPPPHWVRVVGSFSMFQFKEKRLPTLEEINAAAPDTPVFILHLYDRALLNAAALRAVGYTRDTPEPPGGIIERDSMGNPTGLLLAAPNATILYATLAKGPKLEPEAQVASTRRFMRELNRLGVTSVIDAGGGFQNYPDDYAVIRKLADNDQLTVRIAYNLFTQRKGEEREDFVNWARMVKPGDGSDWFRHNGAGEMLVFSAADFEDFFMPRPDLAPEMEAELEGVVRVLVANRWPFRMHATYDETIARALDVFETVNRDIPFDGLHWFFDHAETVSQRSMDRIAALGGGIAIQHRMAFQGDAFVARYGERAAQETPPVARMLAAGLPVGGGTDATRVASYNPWTALWWLVSGKALGGTRLAALSNRLDRHEALSLWTVGSSWFSTEVGRKGQIKTGQFADFAALSADYLSVPEDDIPGLESVLTVVGGRVVHGAGPYATLAPPMPPASLDWVPSSRWALAQKRERQAIFSRDRFVAERAEQLAQSQGTCCSTACGVHGHAHLFARTADVPASDPRTFWGALGCSCFAF